MTKTFIFPVAALAAGAIVLAACHGLPGAGLLASGVRASEDGLWDQASERWKEVLAGNPDSPAAHNNLAVAAERDGRNDEARRGYQKAAELAPENPYIGENLARFERSGRPAAGEEPAIPKSPGESPGIRLVSFPVRLAPSVDLGQASEILLAPFRQERPGRELADWLSGQLTDRLKQGFAGTVGAAEVDWSGAPGLDDPAFWKNVGAGHDKAVILSGSIVLSGATEKALPAGGFVSDGPFKGQAVRLMERRRFALSLDSVLFSAATGERIFSETYSETQIYDGSGPADEVAFAALLDKLLPRLTAALLGSKTTESRYLLTR
ncbi:MAG TPA: tetratricopeptide repeat protein [Desulfobaccales bacterium]|nr:tetratricopeptide repeat protein [Desulfobaccales bacterium]